MIDDLDQLVTSAVTQIFSTMLGMELRPAPLGSVSSNGDPQIAGAVGFIGRLTGVVYIYTTVPFARRITAAFLGMSDAEVESEEMINDAIGEMANMVVGQMKSRLSDRGIACALTIPSVVRGSHFSIEAITTVEGKLYNFEACGKCLIIQVLFKRTEPSQT